jgi:hypothetical protein
MMAALGAYFGYRPMAGVSTNTQVSPLKSQRGEVRVKANPGNHSP